MPKEDLVCPYCGFDRIPNGSVVCRGCNAEIIYGSTDKERSSGCLSGCVWAFVLAGIALIITVKLEHHFTGSSTATLTVQLCFWLSLPVALVLGMIFGGAVTDPHKGKVRFFRDFRHQR